MRALALGLVTTVVVASTSWALMLIGAGESHGASLRLVGGVRVVLHHPGEPPHGVAHGHEHGDGHGHQHEDGVPDDHVVAVSTDPASLRSHDANLLPDRMGSAFAVQAVMRPTPPLGTRGIIVGARAPTPLALHRSTTVLLI